MIRDGRYKLVYYARESHRQLFDLENDPHEMVDLVGDAEHAVALGRLTDHLCEHLCASTATDDERAWFKASGELVGLLAGVQWPPPINSA